MIGLKRRDMNYIMKLALKLKVFLYLNLGLCYKIP